MKLQKLMSRCVHIKNDKAHLQNLKPCYAYRLLALDDQTIRTIRRMTKEFLRCLTNKSRAKLFRNPPLSPSDRRIGRHQTRRHTRYFALLTVPQSQTQSQEITVRVKRRFCCSPFVTSTRLAENNSTCQYAFYGNPLWIAELRPPKTTLFLKRIEIGDERKKKVTRRRSRFLSNVHNDNTRSGGSAAIQMVTSGNILPPSCLAN